MKASFLLFGILFIAVFLIVSGGIAAIVVTSIARKRKNDRSPVVTVDAAVLSRHTSTQRHPIAGDASGAHGYTTFTSYHVTFLIDGSEQIVLDVDEETYASLIEGAHGRLTHQGTRYLGFVRGA